MHRLFVALRLPPPVREALLEVQDGVAGARWQDDEQLHLTLRYIGAVDRPVAEDAAAALGEVRAPAPTMRIDGVGAFDSQGGQRASAALWAGVAPREPLAALHRKLDRACVQAGLAPERRAYMPHVTLARLPRGGTRTPDAASWLARHAGLTSPAFTATHFVLYESILGSEGAVYQPIDRWPLDGA